jgi:hypothetical protein
MYKVYIASPYTVGDQALNVRKQMQTSNTLIGLGYVPFSPLLMHFQHMLYPRPYQTWMFLDLEWLATCDIVLRLPGTSKGADMEEKRANELNIPVVYSIDELNQHFGIEKEPLMIGYI